MLDPNRPYAYLSEREPYRDELGKTKVVDVNTVFLTASRCPIGCTMCDLHLNTLPHPTEPGAILKQIDFAKNRLGDATWIKLYNSGNFFDPASIPPDDYAEIARRCQNYERIIIENHPRFGTRRHEMFRDQVGVQLEVAVGLETVQPRMLDRLHKKMSRDDFDQYARFLSQIGLDLRVFLIVGAPGLSVSESLRWARLSVRHAVAAGARHVSLIPARSGHGWNGMADSLPTFRLTELVDLFAAALDDLAGSACLSIDLWDIDQQNLASDDHSRLNRLASAILSQNASDL